MRRIQLVVLVVVAVVLVWVGATRDTVAQAPAGLPTTGRYSLSLVPVSAGNSTGYYAMLLDTQTGRVWSSANHNMGIRPFAPLGGGPAHEPQAEKP